MMAGLGDGEGMRIKNEELRITNESFVIKPYSFFLNLSNRWNFPTRLNLINLIQRGNISIEIKCRKTKDITTRDTGGGTKDTRGITPRLQAGDPQRNNDTQMALAKRAAGREITVCAKSNPVIV